MPRTKPDVIFVGLNDRDPAWHDLYQVTIATGERTLLRKNTDRISSWVFDEAGTLRLAGRTADNGDTEILRVDAGGFTPVYSCSVFETCRPVRFHKDGTRAYLVTNKGDADLIRLTLFDPGVGEGRGRREPTRRTRSTSARRSSPTSPASSSPPPTTTSGSATTSATRPTRPTIAPCRSSCRAAT